MCRRWGIGSEGAAQHAVYCRGVSVRELVCARCAQSGGAHRGDVVGCYAGSFPRGPIFHTHVMLHLGATMSHRVLCPLRCEIRGECAGGDTVTI